jgi:hypothetical protein
MKRSGLFSLAGRSCADSSRAIISLPRHWLPVNLDQKKHKSLKYIDFSIGTQLAISLADVKDARSLRNVSQLATGTVARGGSDDRSGALLKSAKRLRRIKH